MIRSDRGTWLNWRFVQFILLVAFAALLGVFAALSIDRCLNARRPGPLEPRSDVTSSLSGAAPTSEVTQDGGSATPAGMVDDVLPADVAASPKGAATGPVGVASFAERVLAWEGEDELDPGMYPTADGLFARTSGMWSDAEFLELTEEEALELFPLDEVRGSFTAPSSLLSAFGALPTRKDCEAAMLSPAVGERLVDVCAAELEVVMRQCVPPRKRTAEHEHDVETLQRALHDAEDALWRELEQADGRPWGAYGHAWRLWSE